MRTARVIASSSAAMTSCSVFFITRQRSGRIGRSEQRRAELVRDGVLDPVAVAHEDRVVEVLALDDVLDRRLGIGLIRRAASGSPVFATK